jgi:hypothetical protein
MLYPLSYEGWPVQRTGGSGSQRPTAEDTRRRARLLPWRNWWCPGCSSTWTGR